MHARTSFAAAMLGLTLAAAPQLHAQSLDAARVAFHMPTAQAPRAMVAAVPSFSPAERYIILGAAVLIVGALVGHDAGPIIMIGGGAVMVYGLYLYLDQHKGATQVGLSTAF